MRILANSVSRKDLLSERDAAREDAKKARQEKLELQDELNVTKASQDSLQGDYDRRGQRLREVNSLNEELHAKVVALTKDLQVSQENLRESQENFKALGAMALRQVKWRGSRYNYAGFKNAIAQLRLRNPNLDVTGICPNKVVEGRLIRDPINTDAIANIPRMPSKYDLEGYKSDGDEDFPWFPDTEVPPLGEDAPAETVPPAAPGVGASGVVAQEVEANVLSGENAEDAPSAVTTESAPSAT